MSHHRVTTSPKKVIVIGAGMAGFTLAGMALGAFHPRDVLRQLRRRAPRSAVPANPS